MSGQSQINTINLTGIFANIDARQLNSVLRVGPIDSIVLGGGDNYLVVSADGEFSSDLGGGNDTIRADGTRNLRAIIDGGSGNDTLNLTRITDDLTVTLDSVTGLTVTDGTNTLMHVGNSIEHLLGGKGNDLYVFHDGATLASAAGDIADAAGDDLLNYSAYTSPVQVDLLLGTATGTMKESAGVPVAGTAAIGAWAADGSAAAGGAAGAAVDCRALRSK